VGRAKGGYGDFESAQAAMCGLKPRTFKPDPENHKIYKELFQLYARLHDAFGTRTWSGNLFPVMKDLLAIRDRQRKNR
jgi:L-ribulokinase